MKHFFLLIFLLEIFVCCDNKNKENGHARNENSNQVDTLDSHNVGIANGGNVRMNYLEIGEKVRKKLAMSNIRVISTPVANDFLRKFRSNTLLMLQGIKSNVNESIVLSRQKLMNFINLDKNANSIEVAIVQPNVEFTSKSSEYGQIALHSENDLYLLFSLFDTISGKRLTGMYDLARNEVNPSDVAPILIQPDDTLICLQNFRTSLSFKFYDALQKIKPDNTRKVYVDLGKLTVILNAWQQIPVPNGMQYDRIILQFAEVDSNSSNLDSAQKAALTKYHKQLCLLWSPRLNDNYNWSSSYADMNDLCPPTCK